MSRADAEPPSSKARLDLFCEFVGEYEELAQVRWRRLIAPSVPDA